MVPLSETEKIVAEQYCHGLMDGEIAEALKKPVWTIRTHKKRIYKKLGIATTHELVLYMVAVFVGKKWDAKEVRRMGLAAILMAIMLFQIAIVDQREYRRGRRIEIEIREDRPCDGEC